MIFKNLAQKIKNIRISKSMFWGLFLFCICLSLVVYLFTFYHNQKALRSNLETLANETETLVKKRFEHYEYGLHGARGLVVGASIQNLNRTIFKHYMESRDLEKEFSGARGFGFIRKVPVDKENEFVSKARSDNAPHFAINALEKHSKDRFVIQYIYPEELNEGALGLDIASESNRRQAAVQAARDGQPRLTAPITLVQASGSVRQGFLALLAVYDPLLSTHSPDARERAVVGWVYAPLVVEEVLSELGMQEKGMKFSLTDKAETVAFFENIGDPSTLSPYSESLQREVQLMGRQWRLYAQSLPAMRSSLGLWSPIWVAFVSFVLCCLCLLAFWYRKYTNNQPVQAQIESISIRQFLCSTIVSKLSRVYLGVSFVFLIIVVTQRFPEQMQQKSTSLKNQVARGQSVLQRSNQEYTEDILFLASTPPIEGLTGVLEGQNMGNVSEADWKRRLIDIFKAYVISSTDVYQVRFIRAKPDGQELVRVERKNHNVFVVPDSQLQFKGDRKYVAETLALDNGQVRLSDIELNNENGALEIPHRPTFRYSAPVFTSAGEPFGIVIINVDAEPLLTELKDLALSDETLYAVNSKNDFIVHPDKSRRFGSDKGRPYDWTDEFTLSTVPLGLALDNIEAWKSLDDHIFSAEHAFIPGSNKNVGKVIFIASSSLNNQYLKIVYVVILYVAVLLIIGLMLGVLLYFSWARSQRAVIEHKQVSQRQKDKMFRSLLELSPEALIICNSDGDIEIINSQTESLFRYSRNELLGQHISFLIPYYVQKNFMGLSSNNLNVGADKNVVHEKETYGTDAYGEEFPVEVNFSPVQLEDKLLIASSVRNITQRKHVENSLRQASFDAEKANKAKSSFLANMSHEIRTPLNAIIGLTYLLQGESLSKQQRNLVNKVKLAGRSLLGIVNDVLDLAKIEANEVDIHIQPHNIKQLLNELQSVFSAQAESKGLLLKFDTNESIPNLMMIDDKLLRQILTNLLGNAIKFTQYGHVLLTAGVGENKSDEKILRIEVEDTGIGISEDAQKKLFQPFSQAEEDTNRRFGGTGLGLSIVNSMSSLLGAEVTVNSTPGVGSQFTLSIPLCLPTSEEVESLGGASDALTVLIAEDDDVQREKLEGDSKALGWKVTSVVTGAELVSEIRRLLSLGLPIPDVLMVDWQMPELDGLQALALISEEIGRQRLPAVLVISAFERERIIKLDSNHLVDHILQKPIGTSQLFNAVNDVVVKHTGNSERVLESTHTEAIKAKWLPKIKILVVDDSEINLEVVGNILERNGAIVTTALSGSVAIDCLSAKPDSFDIVLMDVQMPDMDGLETTQAIRKKSGLTELPIVALTAGTLMEEKKRALKAGMNDFLSKPIEPTKLIRTIRKQVELYREGVIPVESATKKDPIELDVWPVICGLERNADLLDGDLPLLVSVLQNLFHEHVNLTQIEVNEEASCDELAIAAQVHKLRGSAGLIGAKSLFNIAGKAEIALRTDGLKAKEWLEKLGQEIQELKRNSHNFLEHYQANLDGQVYPSGDSNMPSPSEELLEDLKKMLKDSDIAALSMFQKYSEDLKGLFNQEEFNHFSDLILGLNFQQALTILDSKNKVG